MQELEKVTHLCWFITCSNLQSGNIYHSNIREVVDCKLGDRKQKNCFLLMDGFFY